MLYKKKFKHFTEIADSLELSTPAPVAVAHAVVKPVPAVIKPVSAAIKPVLPVQTGLFSKESTPPAAKPVVAAVSGTTKKNLDRNRQLVIILLPPHTLSLLFLKLSSYLSL